MIRRFPGAKAITALCVAGAVALPAAAQAEQDFTVDFGLPNDHGVHVYFQASGGDLNGALFSAFRNEGNGGVSSTYSKQGKTMRTAIAQDRIDLDFGRRGRVETDFTETGTNRFHVPGCEGYMLARRGEFAGTMRFRGEGGYAVTRARRALGHIYVDHLRNCRRHGDGGRRARATTLSSCTDDGNWVYNALVERKSDFAVHVAREQERRAGITVSRDAVWLGRARSFEATGDQEAMLRPGGSYRGSATLRNRRLSGDLGVKVLGHRRPQHLTPAQGRLRVTRHGALSECTGEKAFDRSSRGLMRAIGPATPAERLASGVPERFRRFIGR